MKTSMIILAGVLFCISISAAQEQQKWPKDPAKAGAAKELSSTIVSFCRNTVEPELLKWKAQLDAALSPQDLQALNILRKKARILKLDEQKTGRQIKTAWRDEDYAALKKSRDMKKDIAKDRKELLADLKPITVKYKATLVAIGDIAKPKAAEWKAEAKKFVGAWVDKNKETFGEDRMNQALALLRKRFAGIPGLDKETKAKVAAAKFMLWDGSDFTQTFEGGVQGINDSPQ